MRKLAKPKKRGYRAGLDSFETSVLAAVVIEMQAIAELSVNFGSQISSDPADRLIAATSVLRNAPVVTADRNLRDAPMVETIW